MTKKRMLSLMMVVAAACFAPAVAMADPPEDASTESDAAVPAESDAGDISVDAGDDDGGPLGGGDDGGDTDGGDNEGGGGGKKKDSGCSVGHGEGSSTAALLMVGVAGALVTRRRRPR